MRNNPNVFAQAYRNTQRNERIHAIPCGETSGKSGGNPSQEVIAPLIRNAGVRCSSHLGGTSLSSDYPSEYFRKLIQKPVDKSFPMPAPRSDV